MKQKEKCVYFCDLKNASKKNSIFYSLPSCQVHTFTDLQWLLTCNFQKFYNNIRYSAFLVKKYQYPEQVINITKRSLIL